MHEAARTPARTYVYTLTSADALAWRRLRMDWSAGEKWFGGGLVAATGFILAALPEEWVGVPYDMRFLAALGFGLACGYAIFRLVIELNDRRLARLDIPVPENVTLEDWTDHLVEHRQGDKSSLALAQMGPVLETANYVFAQGPDQVMIIPASAFSNTAEKHAFAVALESKANEVADVPEPANG